MKKVLVSLAGIAAASCALGATASANVFTTNGVDTRYQVNRTIGGTYGKVGQVAVHLRKTRDNGETYIQNHTGATAFLVSPCHAMTNAHVAAPGLRGADGKVQEIFQYELRLGPPANGRPFRDSTIMRIVEKGQLYDRDVESEESFEARYVPNKALGLSPEIQRELAVTGKFRAAADWALMKLDHCLGNTYGYFEIDPNGGPSAEGAGKEIELAGYPRGVDQTIISRNCRSRGPIISLQPILNYWSYSHTGFRMTDCTLQGGNSGGPVYYFDGRGEARIIGIIAQSTTFNTDNEAAEEKLHIPREYFADYQENWGGLPIIAGYVDIRQALASPRVMQALAPYQPALRSLADGKKLRDYQENAFEFFDGASLEHLLAKAREDVPDGYHLLHLARLNRQLGKPAEAVKLESMAETVFTMKDLGMYIEEHQPYIDPALIVQKLTLLIDAYPRLNLDKVDLGVAHLKRLIFALKAGDLALARRDLAVVQAMQAEGKGITYPSDLRGYSGHINFQSGNYAAAIDDFAAEKQLAGCESCGFNPLYVHSYSRIHGKQRPERVAEKLSTSKDDDVRVRYRLRGKEYWAPWLDFQIFYVHRGQNRITPIEIEINGVTSPYDPAKHGDGGVQKSLIDHGKTGPQFVAQMLLQKLRDDAGAKRNRYIYELDGVRYAAFESDYEQFWIYRYGRSFREIAGVGSSSADRLARGDARDAIMAANAELILNPDDFNALLNKAKAQYALGFWGVSVRTYTDLIARIGLRSGGGARALTAEAFYYRGAAYDTLGKRSLAMSDYRRASQLVPGNATYAAKARGQ